MKKTIFTIVITVSTFLGLTAQNVDDALILSQDFYTSTARSAAMGGAFGSLGGDFSVASTNPAGMAVYRNSYFTISPTVYRNNTTAQYRNQEISDYDFKLGFSNLGYNWFVETGNESGWISTSLGLGFNKLNNYNRNALIRTNAAGSSLLDEFTYYANSGSYNDFYEGLAEDADVMYWDTSALAFSNDFADYSYGQFMERTLITDGKKNEFSLSFAANYDHVLYIGASVGIQRFEYESSSIHEEIDNKSTIAYTNSFEFSEFYDMYGTGYNFKIGIIGKPVDFIRIGAAVHSPTMYNLTSEFYTEMESTFDDVSVSSLRVSSKLNEYEYKFLTPTKLIGSLGVQIGALGMISFEGEYMDYSNMRFRSDDNSFNEDNSEIQDKFGTAINLKAGAEFRLGPISLRGGYGYYASPLNSSADLENYNDKDRDIQLISGGIGVRSEQFVLDLGLVHQFTDENYYLYGNNVADVNTELAQLESVLNKIILTLGFKF